MERYDPDRDAWEKVAPLSDRRINFGVAVLHGFIYVVGGHNGGQYLNSVERYDPHQDCWKTVASMGMPRTGQFQPCFIHFNPELGQIDQTKLFVDFLFLTEKNLFQVKFTQLC